jgi:hypothetical protein
VIGSGLEIDAQHPLFLGGGNADHEAVAEGASTEASLDRKTIAPRVGFEQELAGDVVDEITSPPLFA